jgi:hypothetical protein
VLRVTVDAIIVFNCSHVQLIIKLDGLANVQLRPGWQRFSDRASGKAARHGSGSCRRCLLLRLRARRPSLAGWLPSPRVRRRPFARSLARLAHPPERTNLCTARVFSRRTHGADTHPRHLPLDRFSRSDSLPCSPTRATRDVSCSRAACRLCDTALYGGDQCGGLGWGLLRGASFERHAAGSSPFSQFS